MLRRVAIVVGTLAVAVATVLVVPAAASAGSLCPLPKFGPGRSYHPHINPANFSANVTNKLFPLRPGRPWSHGTRISRGSGLFATTPGPR